VAPARKLVRTTPRTDWRHTAYLLGASDNPQSNSSPLSLETIRKQLATATRRGGIIADPRIPSDFYHNARLCEQRGDYPNARRSYLRFFTFQHDVVDPHSRYQQLLVIQEGRAAARRAYLEMEQTAENFVVPFMAVLLEPDEIRVQRLSEFVDFHPEFAPAVWELSREYSKTRLGVQGLADMAREKELLAAFMHLNDTGHVLRYFLDQTVASEMIGDATTRLAALEQFDETVFDNPMRFTVTMSSSNWAVNLAWPRLLGRYSSRSKGRLCTTGPATRTTSTSGPAVRVRIRLFSCRYARPRPRSW